MATKNSIDLSRLVASGVYTIENDMTVQPIVADANTLRLLVGFNKKGPFNVPVFLNSDSDRAKVFGDIDMKLERKGCYFNRMAQTLLTSSPILALNLLHVDESVQGPDQVNYGAMSCAAGVPNPEVRGTTNSGKWVEFDTDGKPIENVGKTPYASLFDRSKFWNPSEDNLMAVVAKDLGTVDVTTFEHTNFLNFANTGTEEISVLVFKPENLSGYDVTCKDWYGSEDKIPFGFMRPSDYIADYFIQVLAVKGNWTDYKNLSVDPTWSEFFDASGIRKSKVNDFIGMDGITLVGSWIGTIIPDFKDKMGSNQYIIPKINNNVQVTGLLAAFNEDAAAVLRYDYNGEEYNNIPGEGCWFLDLDESGEMDSSLGESGVNSKTFLIDMVGHEFANGYEVEVPETTTDASGSTVPVLDASGNQVYKKETKYGIRMLSYNKNVESAKDLLVEATNAAYFFNVGTDGEGNGPIEDNIFSSFVITDRDEADKIAKGDLVQNVAFGDNVAACTYQVIPGLTKVTKKIFIPLTIEGDLPEIDPEEAAATGKWYVTTEVTGKFVYKTGTFTYTGPAIYDAKFGTCGFYLYTTIDGVKIADSKIIKQYAISDLEISTTLSFIPMRGLSISARHLPGYDADGNIDAEGGVEKIYSVLNEEGMQRGLCNSEMVDFRYIVDSMGYGLNTMLGGKVYLSRLAKAKGKCTALLNLPSIKQFTTSTDPYFCDTFTNGVDIKPAFDTKYIPLGGNDELYSTRSFSLPDEDNGAKFTAVFGPYLKYSVSGKSILVPPAADVANVLVRKFQGGDPYMICANLNGLLSNQYMTGVEYKFDLTDREYLEPMGINPIITRNGNVMIYGNQTTYQVVKSDFNKLHVRENLNTLEIEIENILHNYTFQYNNAITRAAVVTNLTPVLEAMLTSGAIEDYEIKCDAENNPEEIVFQDILIVDTSVVMSRGCERIASRITLKRDMSKS